MPGFLLHVGAIVTCAHEGMATPLPLTSGRVLVMGEPVVTMPTPYIISGCPFPPPPVGNGPCVEATWLVGALRVMSLGQPVLLQDSEALCVPTGTPLIIDVTQVRVKGI